MEPTERDWQEFWKPQSQREIIEEQFANENISDVQLLHIHQRIEALEKAMNTQRKGVRLIRKILKMLLS